MLQASQDFAAAIKAQEIHIRCEVVFNYSTPLTIPRENIVRFTEEHTGDVALGGLQNDKIILELTPGSLSDTQITTDTTVDIFVGCLVNDAEEYIKIGTYKTVKYMKEDYSIEVELGTNINTNEEIKSLMSSHDVFLSFYIQDVTNYLFGSYADTTAIKDYTLSDAYAYYKTVGEQLKALGVASNCMFRYTSKLELVPYYFTNSCYTLSAGANGALLEDNTHSIDSVNSKKLIEIQKSRFIFEKSASIYSANFSLQSEENCYLDITFSGPSVPRYCVFGKQVNHEKLNAGMFGGSMYLSNPYENALKTELNIIGDRVISKSLGLQNDKNKQYITNPYIQSDAQIFALDSRVITGIRKTYKIKGDPRLQVGDTIETPSGDLLITKISSTYDGSYLSTIEGSEIGEHVDILEWDGTWEWDGTKEWR